MIENIEKKLKEISARFASTDTYPDILEKTKEITKEFSFFDHVIECSDLVFWKAFEHGRGLIETDKFEKQLYTFFWNNQEENGLHTESKIAHFLFMELAKRSPTSAEIKIPQIAND